MTAAKRRGYSRYTMDYKLLKINRFDIPDGLLPYAGDGSRQTVNLFLSILEIA